MLSSLNPSSHPCNFKPSKLSLPRSLVCQQPELLLATAWTHHGQLQVLNILPKHVKVVDLSADFRLRDVNTYAEWYGGEHKAPELQKEAVYGLTELHRPEVAEARLVANPGCYPTSVQLPLVPLLKAELISGEGIIIDAKSGVSGAGRAAKEGTLFCEVRPQHCPPSTSVLDLSLHAANTPGMMQYTSTPGEARLVYSACRLSRALEGCQIGGCAVARCSSPSEVRPPVFADPCPHANPYAWHAS